LQSVLKVAKEVTCGQTDGVDRKSCETQFRTIVWCYHHEFQCHVCRLPLVMHVGVKHLFWDV